MLTVPREAVPATAPRPRAQTGPTSLAPLGQGQRRLRGPGEEPEPEPREDPPYLSRIGS